MNKETPLQRKILLAMSAAGYTMFRNNVGLGWVGEIIRRYTSWGGSKFLLLKDPRPLRCGLVKDSSDLVGWRSITITPEMVGTKVAVFVGAEIKTETGRVSQGQKRFRENLAAAGGEALILRSVDDVPR